MWAPVKRILRGAVGGTQAVKLGRWSVDAAQRVVDRRSELASMDNCGVSHVPAKKEKKDVSDTPSKNVKTMHANSIETSLEKAAFDSSMDASLCALQSLHGYARR